MTKPKLFLTTEDPYVVYGPGDKIRGTANLELVNPLLAKYVIVSLLAGCRITPFNGKTNTQNFFHKQFRVPFHNRREDKSKQLKHGSHTWDFEFNIPTTNDLPPSFYFRDEVGCIEVLYCLVMCIYKQTASGLSKDDMATLTIKYSPKRSPSLLIDSRVLQLRASLEVQKRPGDQGLLKSQRRKVPLFLQRLTRRHKFGRERFDVTLCLPRYAAFTDHMDISLKIQTEDQDPMRILEIRLTRVEYRLIASTRVTYDQASRHHRQQIQCCVCNCSAFLGVNGGWVSLRRYAPFRVQPKIHGMPLDKNTFSTFGPSFATDNIIREYTLDIDLFILIYGKLQRFRYEDNELIVVPQEVYLRRSEE